MDFGVGVRAANPTPPKSPEEGAKEASALVDGYDPVVEPPSPSLAPVGKSGSDQEISSLNEVAPTPIDPTYSVQVGVVGSNSHARKPDVNMPLTPPMSPKTVTTAPFVIPGPVSPPKLKVAFTSLSQSTV